MNENEEILSNISYTNSDFRSIYPELLDTAKKLTNKWDPSLSNEADPGVVLLKENAMVADKNNYHIDKNVLECFPLSCTQQASARQLYDLAGYNMHWYKSGICDITFSLTNTITEINEINNTRLSSVYIPVNTQVVDQTGEYIYTTLEKSTELGGIDKSATCMAIQGKIVKYELNGNYNITLDNLDEDLRIYFPESFIAQNGIFVYNNDQVISKFENSGEDENIWKIVDNLNQYPSGSKIFKFGVSISNDTCYIQFPDDIASLIKDGLNIYYTITQGLAGSVKSGVLDTFNSDVVNKYSEEGSVKNLVLNDYIRISNSASVEASDVESLNDAYKNYKKQVGTFNTLVTRKDYESAIYNLNYNNKPITSNIVVADRTSDMNASTSVMQWDLNSSYKKLSVKKDSEGKDILNAYDIVLYMLKKPSSLETVKDFNASFESDYSIDTLNKVDEQLDSLKCVQHNYIIPSETLGNYFDVENICQLNGVVTTYYKVTSTDAKSIENNVRNALIQKYNAREIDFGNELSYNELVDTIKNADSRIRNVSLNVPTYIPNIHFNNNVDRKSAYGDTQDAKLFNDTVIAKMVLAGNTQLFKFVDDFQIDFGQLNSNRFDNIKSISSSVQIDLLKNSSYTLRKNELITIVYPVLADIEKYGSMVEYDWTGPTIYSGKMHVISDNDELKLKVVDPTSGQTTTRILNNLNYGGKIISSNITINENSTGRLYSNEYIYIKELSKVDRDLNTNYYIITNNRQRINGTDYCSLDFTSSNNFEVLLKDNEYFIYNDIIGEGVVIKGSGTTIKMNTDSDTQLSCPVVDITSYLEESSQLENLSWKKLPKSITIFENNILNLSEGDTCSIKNSFNDIQLSLPGKENDFVDFYENSSITDIDTTNKQFIIGNKTYYYNTDSPNIAIYTNPSHLISGNSTNHFVYGDFSIYIDFATNKAYYGPKPSSGITISSKKFTDGGITYTISGSSGSYTVSDGINTYVADQFNNVVINTFLYYLDIDDSKVIKYYDAPKDIIDNRFSWIYSNRYFYIRGISGNLKIIFQANIADNNNNVELSYDNQTKVIYHIDLDNAKLSVKDNSNISINYNINKEESSSAYLTVLNIPDYKIKLQSRLLIHADNSVSQILLLEDKPSEHPTLTYHTQSVKLTDMSNNNVDLPYLSEGNVINNLMFNYAVDLPGGNDMDVRVLDESSDTYKYDLSAYYYNSSYMVKGYSDSNIMLNTFIIKNILYSISGTDKNYVISGSDYSSIKADSSNNFTIDSVTYHIDVTSNDGTNIKGNITHDLSWYPIINRLVKLSANYYSIYGSNDNLSLVDINNVCNVSSTNTFNINDVIYTLDLNNHVITDDDASYSIINNIFIIDELAYMIIGKTNNYVIIKIGSYKSKSNYATDTPGNYIHTKDGTVYVYRNEYATPVSSNILSISTSSYKITGTYWQGFSVNIDGDTYTIEASSSTVPTYMRNSSGSYKINSDGFCYISDKNKYYYVNLSSNRVILYKNIPLTNNIFNYETVEYTLFESYPIYNDYTSFTSGINYIDYYVTSSSGYIKVSSSNYQQLFASDQGRTPGTTPAYTFSCYYAAYENNIIDATTDNKFKIYDINYSINLSNNIVSSEAILDMTREDGLLNFYTNSYHSFDVNYTFSGDVSDYKYYVLPVYVRLDTNVKLNITSSSDQSLSLNDFYSASTPDIFAKSITISESGNYILFIKSGQLNFKFLSDDAYDWTKGNNNMTLKYIQKFNGVNDSEINPEYNIFSYDINDSNRLVSVLDIMNELKGDNNFDWSYIVPDKYKVLSPLTANSYFKINHIYNRYTIPKIDLAKSNIKVNPSSIS